MPIILKNEDIFIDVIRVIAKRGYSGATTKILSSAASISEVTLFRKYGSKKELVKKAISYIIDEGGVLEAIQYTGDVFSDIVKFIEKYVYTTSKYGDFISSIMIEISYNKELKDVTEKPRGLYTSLAKLIERYQDEGILRQEFPLHVVAEIIGPIVFVNMIGRSNTKIPPMDVNKMVDNLLIPRLLK